MTVPEYDLNVLIPVDPSKWSGGFGTDYIQGLVASLRALGISVVMSEQAFQNPNEDIDMILVNWPEELQIALSLESPKFLDTINDWRKKGCRMGVVLHNDQPHQRNELNFDLYDLIRGYFDFAIHLEGSSLNTHSNWAERHYIVPHPLMSFSDSPSLAEKENGLLVLGAMRSSLEKSIVHRFVVVGRLRGIKVYVGSFRSFPEPETRMGQWLRWLYWRLILGVKWNFGYVGGALLDDWHQRCRYMLIHRSQTHLNSAIPYTALSNGLVPIGFGPGNVGDVLARYEIPILHSSSWISIWRYMKRVRLIQKADFEKFKVDHNIEAVCNALQQVLAREGLIRPTRPPAARL